MIIDSMSQTPPSPTPLLHGFAVLSHLGVIQAQGEEAAKFLHNQLTQDLLLIKPDEARLAAFCNAKGRMQASFLAFKPDANTVLLICNRDLLATTLKRLSMFVMRAKLKLTDATDQYTLTGVIGNATRSIAKNPIGMCQKATFERINAIGLPPAGDQPRLMLVSPAGAATPAGLGDALTPEQWLWSEVRSGVAPISTPIYEAFVPQMLNYESVGGVNFKKGCYPGQEVVARSQFRGTLKRRAYIVHGANTDTNGIQVGQEVFSSADPEQATGTVALAAPNPSGGWDAIVSMQTASAETTLHLGSATGPVLQLLALPYALLEDI